MLLGSSTAQYHKCKRIQCAYCDTDLGESGLMLVFVSARHTYVSAFHQCRVAMAARPTRSVYSITDFHIHCRFPEESRTRPMDIDNHNV